MSTSMGRVHVLEAKGEGRGPPLVMLHGLSSAGVHFMPMLRPLHAAFSRIILPDLPGHGFSEPPRILEMPGFHDAMLEALDRIVDEPAIVLGNSLGGYAAIRYARERPYRVRGLFLASPAGAAMTEEELETLRSLFRMNHHADAVAFVDRLLSRSSWIRHPIAWGLRRQLRRPEVNAILRIASTEHLLTPEDLARLDMPTLLYWGKDERILPERSLEFFKRHLPPHARVEEPEGLGHAPFLDAPLTFAQRLVRFGEEVVAGMTAAPSQA
ncbi:MAG: alpha/beta fold hydrolase [Myxococcota bacterium]